MRFDFSKRPPRILAHPDNCGSGTWRLAEPVMELRRQGRAIGLVKSDRFLADDDLKKLNPDIILVQRAVGARQAAEVERYRRTCPDAFIILDIDDLLWAIPNHSPAFDKLDAPEAICRRVKRLTKFVDRVIVSTDALKAHWQETINTDVSNVEVVGPYLPDWFFHGVSDGARAARSQKRDSAKIRVGFAGSVTHTKTLNRLVSCIRATSEKIQWVFLGCKPEGVDDLIEFSPLCEIDKYPEKLGSLGLDVAIAPFATTAFDYCKTNLRLGELGALGIPVLHDHDDRGQFSRLNRLLSRPDRFLAEIESMRSSFDADLAIERNLAAFSLTRNLHKFVEAWMPPGATTWGRHPGTADIVVGTEGRKVFGEPEPELPGNCASVTYLCNDGLFPHAGTFTAMQENAAASLPIPVRSGLANLFSPSPSGPVTLKALAVSFLGEPAWDRFKNAYEALIDWGEWAAEHGFGHVLSGSQFALQERPGPEVAIDLSAVSGWFPRMGERYKANQEKFQETQDSLREIVDRRFSASRFKNVTGESNVLALVNATEEEAKAAITGDRPTILVQCEGGATSVAFPPMPNVPDFVLSSEEGQEAFAAFLREMGVSEVRVMRIGECTVDDVRGLAHSPSDFGVRFTPEDSNYLDNLSGLVEDLI